MKWNLFRNTNQGIICSILALIAVGSINIFSASYISAQMQFGSSLMFFQRQLIAAIIGMVVLVVASGFDYRRTRKFVFYGGVGVFLLLVLTACFGITEGGARRWLQIGIIFQPSELAKIAAVFLAADSIYKQRRVSNSISIKDKELGLVMLMGAFVYKQPDMGTAAIIVAIALAIYVVGGMSMKVIAWLCGAGGIGVCYLAMSASYRMERIKSWLDPWAYKIDEGYQAVQAQVAIGTGGFTGMGWGSGMSKFFYLPEAHTDFAFAMFCQEWGFLFTILFIIVPFAFFTQQGIRIACRTEEIYGKMLAFGLTLLISGQALANMLMVMGVLPVIGVPLPFVSYGGTSLVINMACVGVLMNIGRQTKKRLAKQRVSESPSSGLKLVSPDSGVN